MDEDYERYPKSNLGEVKVSLSNKQTNECNITIESVYINSWIDSLGYIYGTKIQIFDEYHAKRVSKLLRGCGMKEEQRYQFLEYPIHILKQDFEFHMKYKPSNNTISMTVVDHMRNYYKKVHLTLDQCCIQYSERI